MLHFINESLTELWRIDNSPRPPKDLIGHHSSESQAFEYENIFERIFDKVNENYGILKTKLLEQTIMVYKSTNKHLLISYAFFFKM